MISHWSCPDFRSSSYALVHSSPFILHPCLQKYFCSSNLFITTLYAHRRNLFPLFCWSKNYKILFRWSPVECLLHMSHYFQFHRYFFCIERVFFYNVHFWWLFIHLNSIIRNNLNFSYILFSIIQEFWKKYVIIWDRGSTC